RCPRIEAAADIQNKATFICEHAIDFARERQEPLYIITFFDIAVLFLKMKRVRWRSEDQINGRFGNRAKKLLRIQGVRDPQLCLIGWFSFENQFPGRTVGRCRSLRTLSVYSFLRSH